MRKIVLLLVLNIAAYFCQAQQQEKLTIGKDFWGYKYYEGTAKISKQEAMRRLEANPEALKLFTQGNANLAPAGIFSFAGGFMIGWPIGQAIAGKQDPQWALAAGGLALSIVGYSFDKSFHNKANKAFDLYNTGRTATSFHFNINSSGLSLAYRF
jgi:hypothetical protein